MKKILLRALGITTVKTIVYLVVMLVGMLFFATRIPPLAFTLLYGFIFALNTFLFAEWIFLRGEHHPIKALILTFVCTYLWDVVFSIAFLSWLLRTNLLSEQSFKSHALYFAIHAVAMGSAYYLKKRSVAGRVLTEGIEN